MDSADANGAAGDTSKKKPRGGGMFAGMKGGFFKKKKDANGGPPEAAAGSADEASGQGAGEDDGPPLPKAQFDGEMPNAHKHVDTEAGVHDDDNDDDDDDDASSPYAHYRLHGEDGAYWAEPAAGRSRPGMDEADEESGTESSDFLTSDGGAEGEEDDEAQDDNDYAHVDVKTFMNELAAEKDPWGSSSASDAERSSDEDNGASEEPTISSKAAARYLFLLDFGFDGSLAIEVAELQMDWDAYSMVSGHLSKVRVLENSVFDLLTRWSLVVVRSLGSHTTRSILIQCGRMNSGKTFFRTCEARTSTLENSRPWDSAWISSST